MSVFQVKITRYYCEVSNYISGYHRNNIQTDTNTYKLHCHLSPLLASDTATCHHYLQVTLPPVTMTCRVTSTPDNRQFVISCIKYHTCFKQYIYISSSGRHLWLRKQHCKSLHSVICSHTMINFVRYNLCENIIL
jgi:hypothetical protein